MSEHDIAGTPRCSVCGQPIEDRGYKHAQCRNCGHVSNLCCDPEWVAALGSEPASSQECSHPD